MEEFDVFVNGRKYHVRRATLGEYVVTIPNNPFSADPIVHESTLFQNPRQATTKKNNPGDAETAAVVSRLRLRQPLPPSLTPLQRLRKSHAETKPLQSLPLPKPKTLQDAHTDQIRAQIRRRKKE